MKLLSWFDVKSKIRKETDNLRRLPESIVKLHFYPDEIIVEQQEKKNIELIQKAFQEWFPNPDTYNFEKNIIYLDIGHATMNISIEIGMADNIQFQERPRFDHLYFSKVLVIDGDLEAPGITFWEKNRTGGAAEVGFTQFLDAIQYSDPETGYTTDEVIQYFAQEIQRFEHGTGNLKITVLPAFSDPLDLFQMNVKPEHISQGDNPWKLRESIDKLATQVGADYVFIDLRAGIYEAFQLLWDETAFLRLVLWLATTSGALEKESDLDPSSMNKSQLSKELKKLWGLKLGKDNSKEAYTINWVYGALSDFKGYLQARDVVRFLEEAAKASETPSSAQWRTRLLPPAAIRSAMNGCSIDRVKELKQESKVFERWATDLEVKVKGDLVIPFSISLLRNDSTTTLVELKKLGVVYEDTTDSTEESRFYIPEIYRIGLGFKFKLGARPKVLSIKRKAIGKGLLS